MKAAVGDEPAAIATSGRRESEHSDCPSDVEHRLPEVVGPVSTPAQRDRQSIDSDASVNMPLATEAGPQWLRTRSTNAWTASLNAAGSSSKPVCAERERITVCLSALSVPSAASASSAIGSGKTGS